jgi:hypothetical protein
MEKRIAFRDGGLAVADVEQKTGLLHIYRDDAKGTITTENAAEKWQAFLDIAKTGEHKGRGFKTFVFWFDGCGPKYEKGNYPNSYTRSQLMEWSKGMHIGIVETFTMNRKTGKRFPQVKWKISSPDKATERSEKTDTRIYI